MNKMKTLCKISLVSITLILLLVLLTALAATENNTGNATIKDNYVSSAVLTTTRKAIRLRPMRLKLLPVD